jgi:hypothetical protein
VEDLHRRLVAEEVVERFHRHRVALDRVDQDGLTGAGQRHLDQAELGPVGAFAQELGVDGDEGLGLGERAVGSEVFGRGDRAHGSAFRLRGHPALFAL